MKKLFYTQLPYTLIVNQLRLLQYLGHALLVCLWDPELQIGGINHFMLPLWNGQGLASPRYGNIAIEKLLQQMEFLGSKKHNLKAKIFGGGEVIETSINQFRIGKRNIDLAKEALLDLGIPIISSSVGGKLGRKILFYTQTGEVRQRYVGQSKNNKKA